MRIEGAGNSTLTSVKFDPAQRAANRAAQRFQKTDFKQTAREQIRDEIQFSGDSLRLADKLRGMTNEAPKNEPNAVVKRFEELNDKSQQTRQDRFESHQERFRADVENLAEFQKNFQEDKATLQDFQKNYVEDRQTLEDFQTESKSDRSDLSARQQQFASDQVSSRQQQTKFAKDKSANEEFRIEARDDKSNIRETADRFALDKGDIRAVEARQFGDSDLQVEMQDRFQGDAQVQKTNLDRFQRDKHDLGELRTDFKEDVDNLNEFRKDFSEDVQDLSDYWKQQDQVEKDWDASWSRDIEKSDRLDKVAEKNAARHEAQVDSRSKVEIESKEPAIETNRSEIKDTQEVVVSDISESRDFETKTQSSWENMSLIDKVGISLGASYPMNQNEVVSMLQDLFTSTDEQRTFLRAVAELPQQPEGVYEELAYAAEAQGKTVEGTQGENLHTPKVPGVAQSVGKTVGNFTADSALYASRSMNDAVKNKNDK